MSFTDVRRARPPHGQSKQLACRAVKPRPNTYSQNACAGLCERMRSLGCTQVVSMENFRSPNFELVADLLFWLLKRSVPRNILASMHACRCTV